MALIEVENLTKTYQTYQRPEGFSGSLKGVFIRKRITVEAVKEVSFQIPEGEICGMLGPNGAGKSTTMKMLCGALYPSSGHITSMGMEPYKERKSYVQRIGAVFGQKSQLIWDIAPYESFRMNQAIYGISNKDFKTRLEDMTTLFGVEDVIHKPTRVLSLGERMKCEFIMAMLHKPEIVFLDEPTIGLDVIAKNKVREFIRAMNEKGTTFLLTTHDLEDVEQLAEHIVVINHGEKVFDDSLNALMHSLGNKKLVRICTASAEVEETLKKYPANTVSLSSRTEAELLLEVDNDRLSMQEFMQITSANFKFTDISIQSLPMDRIITELYQ